MFLWTRRMQFLEPQRKQFDRVPKNLAQSPKTIRNYKNFTETFFQPNVPKDMYDAVTKTPDKNFSSNRPKFFCSMSENDRKT